jgi:hypothetical protein
MGGFYDGLRQKLIQFLDIRAGKRILTDGKMDIKAGEGQAVDTIRVALVGRAGIVGQYSNGRLLLVCRKNGQQMGWEIHIQKKIRSSVCKATGSLRVTIGVGNRDGNDGISCRFLYYLLYFYNPLVERLNIRAVSFWYFSLRWRVSFQIVGY